MATIHTHGHLFTNLETFSCAPQPWGLGYDIEVIKAISAGKVTSEWRTENPPQIGTHGGDRRSEDFQVRDANLKPSTMTADYLIARMARDHEEIHEKLMAGEYKSVRAAAIDAGIIKPTPPMDAAKKAYLKLSESEKQAFYNWITAERETMD